MERQEKDDLGPSEHMCHSTPGDSTSGKYVIRIPRFDSSTPGDFIIFVDLGQKALVGQITTTDSSIYVCMERVPKGDAKEEFNQQANLLGSRTVSNFTTVMGKMTVHIFPASIKTRNVKYTGT